MGRHPWIFRYVAGCIGFFVVVMGLAGCGSAGGPEASKQGAAGGTSASGQLNEQEVHSPGAGNMVSGKSDQQISTRYAPKKAVVPLGRSYKGSSKLEVDASNSSIRIHSAMFYTELAGSEPFEVAISERGESPSVAVGLTPNLFKHGEGQHRPSLRQQIASDLRESGAVSHRTHIALTALKFDPQAGELQVSYTTPGNEKSGGAEQVSYTYDELDITPQSGLIVGPVPKPTNKPTSLSQVPEKPVEYTLETSLVPGKWPNKVFGTKHKDVISSLATDGRGGIYAVGKQLEIDDDSSPRPRFGDSGGESETVRKGGFLKKFGKPNQSGWETTIPVRHFTEPAIAARGDTVYVATLGNSTFLGFDTEGKDDASPTYVAAYDAKTGSQKWRTVLDVPRRSRPKPSARGLRPDSVELKGNKDLSRDIAVNEDGRIFVVGHSAEKRDFVAVLSGPNKGATIEHPFPDSSRLTQVAIGPVGNIFTAGRDSNGHFFVAKFSPYLDKKWQKQLKYKDKGATRELEVDPDSGMVLLLGQTTGGLKKNWDPADAKSYPFLAQYSYSGKLERVRYLPRYHQDRRRATDLTVGPSGTLFVSGFAGYRVGMGPKSDGQNRQKDGFIIQYSRDDGVFEPTIRAITGTETKDSVMSLVATSNSLIAAGDTGQKANETNKGADGFAVRVGQDKLVPK